MALQEIIYTSIAVPTGADDVADLLAVSERNNPALGVTGLLLFDGHRYIQVLEGDPDKVSGLFNTICRDARHAEVELLRKGAVVERAFENWRMAYEALPSGFLEELAENMAVYAMEVEGETLGKGESFGVRLNGMFMDAIAAE